jgi:hypothetical protein
MTDPSMHTTTLRQPRPCGLTHGGSWSQPRVQMTRIGQLQRATIRSHSFPLQFLRWLTLQLPQHRQVMPSRMHARQPSSQSKWNTRISPLSLRPRISDHYVVLVERAELPAVLNRRQFARNAIDHTIAIAQHPHRTCGTRLK